MSGSLIFEDSEKLSPRYVPKVLPHREEQLSLLHSLYKSVLENPKEAYMRVCQLVGPVGTGKTCTALRFGETVEEEAERKGFKVKHVYLNCKLEGAKRFILYRSMLNKIAPGTATRSLSPEEMLTRLVQYLEENDEYILITVDEISYFLKSSKEHLIYDLTRINELTLGRPCRVLGVVFIARSLSFHKMLEESERSTLGKIIIDFPRYSGEQIKDILRLRVEEAFKPGRIDDEVLTYVSDVTAMPPINGDLRVGLDLLLYAGILAEREGYDRVLLDHVRRVHGETYPGITSEDILYMDPDERLILWGLVRALRVNKTAYVSLKDIRTEYWVICEEQNVEPVEEIEGYVQDLIYRGIVDMKSLTEFGIMGVSTEDLERFLDMIVEKLKRGVNEFREETESMG
ncbi:hypothetical protein DRO55_02360 [Candidatus Bathyarchaeota archaeon]|mgnify:CR=1 FL=1|nr:MAG: hypothetical protein DRO55_02360 [Candidatus Bathyarchaeota archaeon]